jgi:two-component system, OmpR family, sensor histidine kinase MtrB
MKQPEDATRNGPWRPGLRDRVTAAFALGALGVSLLLAVSTYAVASSYLLEQRDRTVLRQAIFNARVVADALQTARPALDDLLERLDGRGETSRPLLRADGRWHDGDDADGPGVLPDAFVEALESRTPVRQRIQTPEGLALAIALPLEGSGGVYVEVFSLAEVDRTLEVLGVVLAATATATTLLGGAVGRWASRRALRPLTSVTDAAAAIAEGDLGARIDGGHDPDLAHLATAFNRTADRLQARVDRDARFAVNVSHELRTPLTTMVNAVEVVRARVELDQEGREVLEMLADDVHRFSRTVEDLLEISRFDMEQVDLRLEPTRLGRLVAETADRRAGRPVTTLAAGVEDLEVEVDQRRLARVVENLVDNADRHGRGVTGVRVTATPDRVRIIVEDRGPGVPRDEQERVFERFVRGARGPHADGVGLGLSLALGHVRLHDGRIWAENRRAGGARFVVELPR